MTIKTDEITIHDDILPNTTQTYNIGSSSNAMLKTYTKIISSPSTLVSPYTDTNLLIHNNDVLKIEIGGVNSINYNNIITSGSRNNGNSSNFFNDLLILLIYSTKF